MACTSTFLSESILGLASLRNHLCAHYAPSFLHVGRSEHPNPSKCKANLTALVKYGDAPSHAPQEIRPVADAWQYPHRPPCSPYGPTTVGAEGTSAGMHNTRAGEDCNDSGVCAGRTVEEWSVNRGIELDGVLSADPLGFVGFASPLCASAVYHRPEGWTHGK